MDLLAAVGGLTDGEVKAEENNSRDGSDPVKEKMALRRGKVGCLCYAGFRKSNGYRPYSVRRFDFR